ncbi:hypothetical protein NXS19_005520 [Fusarium pseudograminearum]|nr:hypothetical protein NXS19_005520 [Fusarium pseudograminearum]
MYPTVLYICVHATKRPDAYAVQVGSGVRPKGTRGTSGVVLILGRRLVAQTPNLSTSHFPSHARLTTRCHQPHCLGRVTVQVRCRVCLWALGPSHFALVAVAASFSMLQCADL